MPRLAGYALLALGTAPYLLLWDNAVLPAVEKALPPAVWRVRTPQRLVALTFDDGPDPLWTPQVLALLAREQVHATFFLVGERARQYPDVVAAIRAGGHEIGNHSHTWAPTRGLDAATFETDLLQAEAALNLSAGPRRLFRPAGGLFNKDQSAVLRRHGYTCVLASMIPFDPYQPPARWITLLARRSLRRGAILVFHDSGGDRTQTLAALPRIIVAARDRQLGVTTVSGLLAAARP